MADFIPDAVKIAGGILVGWLGHAFSVRRDRENRRHAEATARAERIRQFEAFLLRWEQTAERTPAHETPNLYFGQAAEQFRSEAAKVRGDFKNTTEFDRLDSNLSRMTPEVIASDATRTSRDKLADAVRAFLQFVRNA